MIMWIVQAVTEVLNKSHYGNSHLEMRQNPVTIAEHSGLKLCLMGSLKGFLEFLVGSFEGSSYLPLVCSLGCFLGILLGNSLENIVYSLRGKRSFQSNFVVFLGSWGWNVFSLVCLKVLLPFWTKWCHLLTKSGTDTVWKCWITAMAIRF